MTRDEIYKALKRPFDTRLISWRAGATNAKKNNGVATKCIALAYIDARDVMQRLDDVLGLDWQCKYTHAENKTICEIGIKVHDEWVWRAGGAGDTDIEAEKGAISDAFKRAAVLFGIGRYLYSLTNNWVDCDEYKTIKAPPQLPEWATPLGFDKGLTAHGNIFGESRTRLFEGMAEEVTKVYSKKEPNDAYMKWEGFLPEFELIEEKMFTWFLLDSDIRSAIKRLQLQATQKPVNGEQFLDSQEHKWLITT